jgi:membrane-bound hydrogenase subunit mbhJ
MFNIGELKVISNDLGLNWIVLKKKIYKVTTKGFKFGLKANINENLFYLIGLIASDGHITLCRSDKNRKGSYKISFANTNKKLIKLFETGCRKFLPDLKISKDKSTGSLTPTRYIYSSILADILKYFGIDRGKKDFRRVLRLPESYVASFLAGYFDGDGHISFSLKGIKRVEIGIVTSDFLAAKRLFILLKRIGIASKIVGSRNNSSFGLKTMYRVNITTKIDMENFIKKLPFRHPKKIQRAKRLGNILKSRERVDMSTLSYAPLMSNNILKDVRNDEGVRQKDIHDPSMIIEMERGKRLKTDTIMKINSSIEKITGSKKCGEVKKMLNSDYYLDPVSEVKTMRSSSQLVYNLSVRGTESYVPEGMFVVKNCNGCAIEILAALTPKHDVERFGIVAKGSPRHADILVVEGPVNAKMKERLLTIYQQMPDPKYVIAFGACPISKGVFYDSYNVVGPLDKIIPVDVYLPGCPPKPEALINAIIRVTERM